MSLLNITAQAALPSKWDIWPFNAGYGGDWQTTLATYLYSAVILGVICLFLRFLFGPGGVWRDKELEREAEILRERELRDLKAQLDSGRITKAVYDMKVRRLDS